MQRAVTPFKLLPSGATVGQGACCGVVGILPDGTEGLDEWLVLGFEA